MKHQEEVIEMRVSVPKSIHRLLKQQQDNYRNLKQPFRSLSDIAGEAIHDGLFRDEYVEDQLRKLREEANNDQL